MIRRVLEWVKKANEMDRYNWENWIIVLLRIVIAVVPLFSQQSRGILVHSGSIAFAVPFILKGTYEEQNFQSTIC